MNKYLSMDSKISLSRTKATDRPQYGKGGEVYQLLYIPRNIPLNDLKTFRSDTQRHIYYVNPTLQELNPYYINYQYSNMDERWRAFGYYTVKIDFTPWLYATGKYSFDYYDTSIEEQNRTNGIDDQSKESYKSMKQRYYEHNTEGMILGHNTFAERFRLGYSLGGNIMYQRTSGLTGYSENMAKEGIWYHNSALGKNTAEQTFTERETRSVFGTLQFAWDEWIALDLTARNDWSSTLPKNNCSYFYPSANLSWVFSDMMRRYDMGLPSWITFGKLRLSAAQDWSARRWDHFYKDRSAEYKTLVNTFYYVDRKAYKNAFYMTRIFYAFLASTMTDTYGEMPFVVYVQGKAAPEKCPYNTQEEVYDMVFRMLTEAADSIQPGQCSFKFADREDKCYNGDEAKWIRFANTLRLRLALRISNVDPERARQEGVAALNHPGGLMQSQDDRMRTVPNYAPVAMGGEDDSGLENEVANCGFRYSDVVMSLDMEQAYKNLGSALDPRCRICWYRPIPKNFLELGREMSTDYKGCAIGDNNISHETNVYSPLKCNHHEGKVLNDNYWFGYCREYLWLGYAESRFLLAEARLREWTYAYGSAEDLFKDGIRESFNYYHMADSADIYIDRLNIYNGTQENPFAGSNKEAQLEQIITQKWLAVFPNGNEGWAEFRRTDYPRLNNHLSNKDPNIANGKFIKRVGYSTDEYAYNIENVPEGVNQSTRVWWDVQDTNNENGERNTPNNFRK